MARLERQNLARLDELLAGEERVPVEDLAVALADATCAHAIENETMANECCERSVMSTVRVQYVQLLSTRREENECV